MEIWSSPTVPRSSFLRFLPLAFANVCSCLMPWTAALLARASSAWSPRTRASNSAVKDATRASLEDVAASHSSSLAGCGSETGPEPSSALLSNGDSDHAAASALSNAQADAAKRTARPSSGGARWLWHALQRTQLHGLQMRSGLRPLKVSPHPSHVPQTWQLRTSSRSCPCGHVEVDRGTASFTSSQLGAGWCLPPWVLSDSLSFSDFTAGLSTGAAVGGGTMQIVGQDGVADKEDDGAISRRAGLLFAFSLAMLSLISWQSSGSGIEELSGAGVPCTSGSATSATGSTACLLLDASCSESRTAATGTSSTSGVSRTSGISGISGSAGSNERALRLSMEHCCCCAEFASLSGSSCSVPTAMEPSARRSLALLVLPLSAVSLRGFCSWLHGCGGRPCWVVEERDLVLVGKDNSSDSSATERPEMQLAVPGVSARIQVNLGASDVKRAWNFSTSLLGVGFTMVKGVSK
mmetsp:Transcript_52715/g.113866  ORF Transcript_52715/g.113866 Transcript_52715/m.113866 type:complete len:466 (-) Transcript_52715:567-1964(-)